MSRILIAIIHFYQKYLRSFHNKECIYTPTCSNYAIGAIQKYGALKGVRYAYLRIRRCNGALYQGGEDWPF